MRVFPSGFGAVNAGNRGVSDAAPPQHFTSGVVAILANAPEPRPYRIECACAALRQGCATPDATMRG